MPRTPAVESEVLPFAIAAAPMTPPAGLSEEECDYWRRIVDPFPAERFQADAMPTLIELVRAMSRSRKLAEQLDRMRRTRLLGASPERAKLRQLFIQLARHAREEAKLVALLSQKLRMTDQSRSEKRAAAAERRAMPLGPRPWET